MKLKALICIVLCYVLTGCMSNKAKEPMLKPYADPDSPFDISLNRDIKYRSDTLIDPSLFGLKDAFLAAANSGEDLNRSAPLSDSPVIDKLISHSFALLGMPYHYGGNSVSTGFDCSGFVSYLFYKEAGIKLPRSTRQMINIKADVVSRSKLKPGDLLFFATGRGRQVSHIGIYIGGDYFIHSANERKGVRIDSLDNRYWSVSFLEAKRVLN